MRIMLMFDLPTVTTAEQKEYRIFRRFLIKNGFIMMQESIYTKLVINGVVAKQTRQMVSKKLPPKGLVQMLTITEKQFADMELLVGESQKTYIDSDKRMIIL